MKLWLVEILVRTGLCVIADGRCRPRWYGSDQSKVCKRVQGMWWHGRRVLGLSYGSGVLTPFKYYCMRSIVSGADHQHQVYRKAASLAMIRKLRGAL